MAGLRLIRFEPAALIWVAGAAFVSALGGLLIGLDPTAALDAAIVLGAAILIAARPYAALLLILLGLAAPRQALPILVLFAGGLAVVVRARGVPGKRVIIPMVLFLALAVPSLPILPSPDEGPKDLFLHLPLFGTNYARAPSDELHGWLNLAAVLVVFCMAAWTVRTPRRLDMLVTAVLASAIYPIAIAFGQLATGDTVRRPGSTLESLEGPFTHPNYFAFYLVVVLAVGVMVFLEARTLGRRAAVGALIAAELICLFLTYTRAAWVGFAVALLVMAVLRYRKLLPLAAVGLLLAVLAAPSATREAKQRFGDLTSQSEAANSNSWTWRVDQWSAILPYGFEKPLTGQGWNSYTRLTVRKFGHSNRRYPTVRNAGQGVYSAVGFTAHNDYVKDFVELGVPGLVLWVLTLLGLAQTAWRARKVPGAAAVSTVMVATVISLMLISASDNLQGYTAVLSYTAALCGALAGITAAASRRRPRAAVASEATLTPAAEPWAVVTETQPQPEPAPEPAPYVTERPTQTTLNRARRRMRGLLTRRRR